MLPSVLKLDQMASKRKPLCPRCNKRPKCVRGYCKPCSKDYFKEYYRANKQRIIAASEARRLADPETHKARKRALTVKRKLIVIAAYGGKCSCCGEKRPEFLAIDHVNGGGLAHRLSLNCKGARFYLWLIQQNFPKKDFRLLCHNCNQSYGLYGYCPHRSPSKFKR